MRRENKKKEELDPKDEENMKKMIAPCDADKDGKLNFDEFYQLRKDSKW